MRTIIASDWHLGHFSPPAAARLAHAFLERACDAGDAVVLNGDIFEGLFEPLADAEGAHPEIAALIRAMERAGQLRRTEGNHDPGSGAASIVVPHARLGRVLVAHGHGIDPLHGSAPGRLGDAISRHLGRFAAIRGAAQLAEEVTMRMAGRRIEARFRAHCRAIVEQRGYDLGVFGHLHRRYLAPGDRYANAGRLSRDRLEFLVLTAQGAELGELARTDLAYDAGESTTARVLAAS